MQYWNASQNLTEISDFTCYHIKKLIFTNSSVSTPCFVNLEWCIPFTIQKYQNFTFTYFTFTLLFCFFVLSNHFSTLHIFFKFARCPPGVCTGAKSFYNLCKRYLSASAILKSIVLVCSWGNLKELLKSDKLFKQCIWPTSDHF